MNWPNELSEEQRCIVESPTEVPILVLAGPGTGKTKVLAARILYLLGQKIDRSNIAAITFTTKATEEMRKRLEGWGLTKQEQPFISTLHSLSLKIILDAEVEYDIADEYESMLLLEDAIVDTVPIILKRKKRRQIVKNIQRRISLYKATKNEKFIEKLDRIIQKYEELLSAFTATDFEGLIVKALDSLKANSQLLETYREKCKFLLIDEFQDINPIEYQLIRLISGENPKLFIVGDDDQSIYGWRGGDVRIILHLNQDIPNLKEKTMTECWRCPPSIAQAANSVIKNNKNRRPKQIISSRQDDNKICILQCRSNKREANYIAGLISQKIGSDQNKGIAVLYKGGDLADELMNELIKRNVQIERPDPEATLLLREFIALLRLLSDKRDSLALRVCLSSKVARGIGLKTIQQLRFYGIGKDETLWQLLIQCKDQPNFKRSRKAIDKFIDCIEKMSVEVSRRNLPSLLRYTAENLGYYGSPKISELIQKTELEKEKSLAAFLEELRGKRGEKKISERESYDTVLFTTMHSVKGLERGIIFVLGMEKDRFPEPKRNIEEQRRLYYVAITRAKQELYLSYAKKREGRHAHGMNFYDPSPFLYEIPDSCRRVEQI